MRPAASRAGRLELIVRDTQSDPTKAVNASTELTRRHKVHVMWGPLNSGEALAATPLIARDNVPQMHPCWVDWPDRPQEMAAGVPQWPTNQQIGARREPLRGEHRQGQEGGGGQRHHGIRHGVAQRLRAHAQDDGRGGGLRGDHRSEQPGREAGDAAHAVRRGAGHHALERERRLPLAPHQHARGDELGRADRRPDDTRLRPNQSPAEEAGVLGEGLPQQLPQLQLRFLRASCRRARSSSSTGCARPTSICRIRCCGGSRSATMGRG